MTENYSALPMSIAEARANKLRSAAAWTPRDALVAALRDIDGGKIKPEQLAVVYVEEDEQGASSFSYYRATPTLTSCIGLLEISKAEMLTGGRG